MYKNDKELLTASDIRMMHAQSKEYIERSSKSSGKAVLIMTHHLPSYQMILPIYEGSAYKSYYASDLDYLFKEPVIAWVCGHSHGFYKKLINGIPCIMNGLGYPSEPRRGADLNYVIEFDTDAYKK